MNNNMNNVNQYKTENNNSRSSNNVKQSTVLKDNSTKTMQTTSQNQAKTDRSIGNSTFL